MDTVNLPTNEVALNMLSDDEKALLLLKKVKCKICGKVHDLNKESWKKCTRNRKLQEAMHNLERIRIEVLFNVSPIPLSHDLKRSLLGIENVSIYSLELAPEIALALGVDGVRKLNDTLKRMGLEYAKNKGREMEARATNILKKIGQIYGVRPLNPRLVGPELAAAHLGPFEKYEDAVSFIIDLPKGIAVKYPVKMSNRDLGVILLHFFKLDIWYGTRSINNARALGYDGEKGVILLQVNRAGLFWFYLIDLKDRSYREISLEEARAWLKKHVPKVKEKVEEETEEETA